MENKFVNGKKDDHDTKYKYIDSDDKWYVHFKIAGGTPGEKLEIYTARKLGKGSFDIDDYYKNNIDYYMVEDSDWIDSDEWYFQYPSAVPDEKWTMGVFTKEDDKCLGYVSIPVKGGWEGPTNG